MGQRDRDLEDFASLLISAAEHIRHSIKVSSYDNCNNCGAKMNCKYLPEWGAMVRINCLLWVEKEKKND